MWPFSLWRRRGEGLGRRGERLAARELRRAGLSILGRDYRCPAGEIDLIALDSSTRPPTIVFVEVKARADDSYTAPEGAVDADKQQRLRRAARYYIAARGAQQYAVRFDVIAVVAPPGDKPRITHFRDAFE
jgi:putative endonuclease